MLHIEEYDGRPVFAYEDRDYKGLVRYFYHISRSGERTLLGKGIRIEPYGLYCLDAVCDDLFRESGIKSDGRAHEYYLGLSSVLTHDEHEVME